MEAPVVERQPDLIAEGSRKSVRLTGVISSSGASDLWFWPL